MTDVHHCRLSFDMKKQTVFGNQCRLMIPLHGKVFFETPERTATVNENDLYLMPFHQKYTAYADVPNESLIIDIPEPFGSQFFKMKLIEHGDCIWQTDNKWPYARMLLMSEISENNANGVIKMLQYIFTEAVHNQASKSVRYIQKHFTEKIDIKDLAAMENYTPCYYSDWFKQTMKITPLKYIHLLRIRRAKELLQDHSLSVLTIAYELGYEYHASFTKMFKNYEKMSPSEYRDSLKRKIRKVQ